MKKSFVEWLQWRDQHVAKTVQPGLERLSACWQQLFATSAESSATKPNAKPALGRVISVAGTNGKGTMVHYLQAVYSVAGYRVASYFSPEMCHYRERVRMSCARQAQTQTQAQNQHQAENAARNSASSSATNSASTELLPEVEWCKAFAAVAELAQAYQLTLFEFDTLVAMYLIAMQTPDITILEVGMGGRLDAVNIVDADVAVVTTIGLDHTDFLGDTREEIAVEKMGIGRAGKPLFCADPEPPHTVALYAEEQDIGLQQVGRDFQASTQAVPPSLSAEAAGALQAIVELWQTEFPVTQQALLTGSQQPGMPGRLQWLRHTQQADVVFDVAHNVESAQRLVDFLTTKLQTKTINTTDVVERATRRVHWVVGMLADKPVQATLQVLQQSLESIEQTSTAVYSSQWYLAALDHEARGLDVASLAVQAEQASIAMSHTSQHDDPLSAYNAALEQAEIDDLIVVTGSFRTVAAIWCLNQVQ